MRGWNSQGLIEPGPPRTDGPSEGCTSSLSEVELSGNGVTQRSEEKMP